MGKKREARKGLENVFFTRTEPSATAPQAKDAPAPDKSVSRGLAMKRSEWDALADIAEENHISRNALIRYVLMRFVAEHAAGAATVEFENVRKLKMP